MITFITGNEHKVIEAENIFKDYGIELEHIDLGYMEPQGTLEDVARFGAKYACQELNRSVIVEDAAVPPVASIISVIITSRSAISNGSLQ